jgi:hypothetical protein
VSEDDSKKLQKKYEWMRVKKAKLQDESRKGKLVQYDQVQQLGFKPRIDKKSIQLNKKSQSSQSLTRGADRTSLLI